MNNNSFFYSLYPLFSKYPRTIGLKLKKFRRKRLHSFNELLGYVIKYNGLCDIYVSVYDVFYGIDKIVFDIDSPNLYDAYVDACLIVDSLRSDDIPYAVVFTGGKGFHVYALFKYWRPPNKETAIVVNKSLYYYYLSTASVSNVDVRLIGDVERLIRVPNTKHSKTKRYAIPLPTDFCSRLDLSDIIDMSRHPQILHIYSGKLRDPREYVDMTTSVYEVVVSSAPRLEASRHSIPVKKHEVAEMLRDIIRPCIWKIVVEDPEPPHDIRTYFVEELVWLGYNVDEIVDIIRALGWIDFNERITRYHVTKIYDKIVREHRLYPPTCKTLMDKGYCLKSSCPTGPWYYWWGLI